MQYVFSMRYEGAAFKESISDKVLLCCESIKQLVALLLDTYNEIDEEASNPNTGDFMALVVTVLC